MDVSLSKERGTKMKCIGIFINCKETPFVDLILAHRKRVETRTKDVFKNLFGGLEDDWVALIETGNGVPMIKGEARIKHGCFVDADTFKKCIKDIACIDDGSKYDSDKGKWCYPITWAYKTRTFPLPKNAVRHGRSWCEFEVSYEEMYGRNSD